jgi:hypothetical protein
MWVTYRLRALSSIDEGLRGKLAATDVLCEYAKIFMF